MPKKIYHVEINKVITRQLARMSEIQKDKGDNCYNMLNNTLSILIYVTYFAF